MFKTKIKTFLLSLMVLSVLTIILMSSVNAASETINPNNGSLNESIGKTSIDTIFLEKGNYSGENNTNLTISNKNITISGIESGVVIDGAGVNWIFNITNGANLTLNNITLQNGYRNNDGGGAIYVNNGSLNCSYVVFYKNEVKDVGGAAIYIKEGGNSFFSNCDFNLNNGANDGGAVHIVSSSVSFTNCIFKNNSAGSNGGAIALGRYSSIYSFYCNFTENTAGGKGGAIGAIDGVLYFNGSLEYCNFNNNKLLTSKVFNAIHDPSGIIKRLNCNETPKDGTPTVLSIPEPPHYYNPKPSDNKKPTPAPAVKKADLKITKVFKKGNYRYVTIKNIGKKTTGKKFYLGIYVGKKMIKKVLVKIIPAGKYKKIKVLIPRKYKNKVKTFKADSTNRIKESNKRNNSYNSR